MSDVYVRVPVTCPVCATESLTPLLAGAILDAMENAAPLRLCAPCHSQAWDATPDEIEQVGEYLFATYKFVPHKEGPKLNV